MIIYYISSLIHSLNQCYQRIYEWRGHFGAAALVAVNELFSSETKLANGKSKLIYGTVNSRKDYVKRELGTGLPFLYSCTDYDEEGGELVSILSSAILSLLIIPNVQVFSGMFKSDLILTVLYGHFKDTSSVSRDLASPEPPRAAIALAAAAVCRSSRKKHAILTNLFFSRSSALSNVGKRAA